MRHKNKILDNGAAFLIRDILLLILVTGCLLLATHFIFKQRMNLIDHQLENIRDHEIK
ncbi:MAG: hypothetical protein ABJC12_05485 [Saprospiraceae bacterium]